MTSAQADKLQRTITSIKSNGWRSINDFLTAFYTSDDDTVKQVSNTNLRYKAGQTFAPDVLIDAWLTNGPKGESRKKLHETITRRAADVMIKESTRACNNPALKVSSSHVTVPYLTSEFGLNDVMSLYRTLLPCLWLFLSLLIMAPNTYEKSHHTEKLEKDVKASRIIVVIISMLLYARNRATDAFQMIMGIFLSSAGAMSYRTVQRCLETLTVSATERAREFVKSALYLWALVYDNINFTLRKSSQRLDSRTEQLNATTSAVFSLPKSFTRQLYQSALSLVTRKQNLGKHNQLSHEDIQLTPDKQHQFEDACKHTMCTILLKHTPSLSKRTKKMIRKQVKLHKPKICCLGHDKTEFFPLPALNEEEASVAGTLRVVTKLFTQVLDFVTELVDTELRLLVRDWLTIQNLCLLKDE
ncbi:hypothetical protein EWM64_g9441 [Hericium alpestre]|uniref:DUF6589 domain-containing protein n=1 Tax=Hericium alpestre TaxID=135208 RepID=A0A4Y9ZL76_9AGAM|nr:hypothetical protein EWM64_g9441 [Hericium alpestre]